MKKIQSIFIPIGLFCLIMTLAWVYDTDTVLTQGQTAYPDPEGQTTLSYPAPSTVYTPPSNVAVSTPTSYGGPHKAYLPFIRRHEFRMSVAGLDVPNGQDVFARMHQVVPSSLATDPYVWDTLPNANSDIQVIRACTYYRQKEYVEHTDANPHGILFKSWYQAGRVDKYCWDPIEGKIGKVVNDSSICSEPSQPCLDTGTTVQTAFRNMVAHPDQANDIWLIGNEPDNATQDAMLPGLILDIGGGNTEPLPITIADYARLFTYMYELLEEEVGQPPKLVFCQATYAWDREESNQGVDYCRQAFNHLTQLTHTHVASDGTITTTPYGARHIYALSTHQYMHDKEDFGDPVFSYENGALLEGSTIVTGTNKTALQHSIERWELYLQDFERWAREAGMGDKPLWLTEFGSLGARCTSALASNGACSLTGEGIYYGRNNNDGIWGMQMGQINYLMRKDNQWQAAWWFSAIMADWDTTIEGCDMTVWLWGEDQNCLEGTNFNDDGNVIVSKAGESLLYTLECLIGQSCQTEWPDNSYIISDPNLPPLEMPSCRPSDTYLCTEANVTPSPTPTVTPTPTPTPTSTPTSCSCDQNKDVQCPQTICDQ